MLSAQHCSISPVFIDLYEMNKLTDNFLLFRFRSTLPTVILLDPFQIVCAQTLLSSRVCATAKSRYYKERQVDREKRKAIRW